MHAISQAVTRWWIGGRLLGVMLALEGCGGETYPEPGFKPNPPLSAGTLPSVKTATLSGNVYVAESTTIDSTTQLPTGYKLLPGEEGRVTVRIPGTTAQTRAVAIHDGAYVLPDLPIGVTLDVTASLPGHVSRLQQVQIHLPAGRRLNFGHDPDGAARYLIPLQAKQSGL